MGHSYPPGQGRAEQSMLSLTCPVHWRQLSALRPCCCCTGDQRNPGTHNRFCLLWPWETGAEQEPWEWVSTRNKGFETLSLFVLLLVLWLHVRAVVLGQVHAVPVEMQSKMSASVPGRLWSVAEPNRWGWWDRWASAGKGDVASVSAQRGRLPSWATSCFPLLSPMGCPVESSSTPQPEASTCASCWIVINTDVRWGEERELLAQGSRAMCHKVLRRSFFGGRLGVGLQGRGDVDEVVGCGGSVLSPQLLQHTHAAMESSVLSPSLEDGLTCITDTQRVMLSSSHVCRSCRGWVICDPCQPQEKDISFSYSAVT